MTLMAQITNVAGPQMAQITNVVGPQMTQITDVAGPQMTQITDVAGPQMAQITNVPRPQTTQVATSQGQAEQMAQSTNCWGHRDTTPNCESISEPSRAQADADDAAGFNRLQAERAGASDDRV
jgi:hypothetical protein